MMLYLMRHGPAEPRDAARFRDDDLRPLSADGQRRTRKASRGLARCRLRIGAVWSSPLARAMQTATIVCDALRLDPNRIRRTDALQPDADPRNVIRELVDHSPPTPILLIGHEPHLSGLSAWLLGAATLRTPFRKAGVRGYRLADPPSAGRAELTVLLSPKVLRAISRGKP